MSRRFVSLWFLHLKTDWFTLRQCELAKNSTPDLRSIPFVLRTPSHGRMVITAANYEAQVKGIDVGMVLADARAIIPDLKVMDDKPGLAEKLLKRIAGWCIRFTPIVAIDPPGGLIFDATGCSHLWGGDESYLKEIVRKLESLGYAVKVAMADTVGAAWAVAHFGKGPRVVVCDKQMEALSPLPPQALRLELDVSLRLHKLGLHQVGQLLNIPRASLRKRFGQGFLKQLELALGIQEELIQPVQPIEPYFERLPCLEPIVTATGIEMALEQLLNTLCNRLQQEQKGLRSAIFKGYRVDGKIEKIEIGTHRPSHHVKHLFKLFEHKLAAIEPALGIELFVLEAPKVEDYYPHQERLWESTGSLIDERLSELIDRLAGKVGTNAIHRYLPDEHYWPERSFRAAGSLQENPNSNWQSERPRPLHLLPKPNPIEVTAPIPDYPPMLFRHEGKIHKIIKADGPERIEQEWWLQQGQHRDYYRVEDEEGQRYWLFRLGHYDDKAFKWFLHGTFA